MRHLSIDIETKSSVDIGKAGLYKYAQSEDFEILLLAYRIDNDPVNIVDFTEGEKLPEHIKQALADPTVMKHAYNAAFEVYCLSIAGFDIDIDQWQCTMIHSMYCGYPASLEAAGKALGLPEDKQKLATGKALIRYFCKPCKPTKSNGGRTWNLPHHDPEKWELFKEYCMQDVITESTIESMLTAFPVPESEWWQWRNDARMNTAGVRADRNLINGALYIDAVSRQELIDRSKDITGLDNPNSVQQLLPWLCEHAGHDIPNLQKATIVDELEKEIPDDVRKILLIRQQLGKTSVKKYAAMSASMGSADRIRGISQFYGANRTGRWSGRLVQLQNLPRNYIKTLRGARNLVKSGNYEGVKMIYGNIPDTLSQLIRTAFIPEEGCKFIVADFSAIEARVIAWLAGETWANEVFATHGKIYEATASQMFHVPVEKIAKGNPEYALRQKGKVATLALGYQGSPNALISQGALKMGLTEEELPEIVEKWRASNPHIVDMWKKLEQAALHVVKYGEPLSLYGLTMRLEGDLRYGHVYLTVELPSGRKLFYVKPFIKENKFGKQAVHFYGVGVNKKWQPDSTYGGKLTENIVQAIARDCLAVTIRRLVEMGHKIVFHVHDEVIIEAPVDVTVKDITDVMAMPISWAPGLVLKGAGFECKFYQKD